MAALAKSSSDKISDAIRKSISRYTAGADVDINKHLNIFKVCDGMEDKTLEKVCKNIYNFLNQSKLDENLIVYRGLSVDSIDTYISSKIDQIYKGFMSTTLDMQIAINFARGRVSQNKIPLIFEIILPKGTKAYHIAKIPKLANSHENEVLVFPGGTLRKNPDKEPYYYNEILVYPLVYSTEDKSAFKSKKSIKNKSIKKKSIKKSIKKKSIKNKSIKKKSIKKLKY